MHAPKIKSQLTVWRRGLVTKCTKILPNLVKYYTKSYKLCIAPHSTIVILDHKYSIKSTISKTTNSGNRQNMKNSKIKNSIQLQSLLILQILSHVRA